MYVCVYVYSAGLLIHFRSQNNVPFIYMKSLTVNSFVPIFRVLEVPGAAAFYIFVEARYV